MFDPDLDRLQSIRVTQAAMDALMSGYLAHRQSDRRREEFAWLLLGKRYKDSATISVAVPVGDGRDAGETHVAFGPETEAETVRLIDEANGRLEVIGVAHTHPAGQTRPSADDLAGDGRWVHSLRGGDGVFAIGVVDDSGRPSLSWWALAVGDRGYRRLAIFEE